MKKASGLWGLACCLLLCIVVVAQEGAAPQVEQKTLQTHGAKTIRILGKVSDDGTRFIENASHRIWIVKNIEALKGFESQQASLRGRVDADTNLIHVLSITGEASHSAHLSDSAFRR
jgi:hypothetical protein